MNRQATDFALMAGAFSKDHKMATQVCRLLADGDVNETVARKMLKLVGDGKLASETPICSHWHWTQPWYVTSATVSGPSTKDATTTDAYSLTWAAQSVLEAA